MADAAKDLPCLNLRVCFGEYAKLFDFGFRQDHFRTAFQMAVATGVASLFLFIPHVMHFTEGTPIYIFVIICIILEPILGKNLKKAVMTAVGGIVGSGLGMAAAASTEFACWKTPEEVGGSTWRVFMALWLIVGLSFLMLMKQRFVKYQDAYTICMLTFILCSFLPESATVAALLTTGLLDPSLTHLSSSRFGFKGFICLTTLIAIVIVALVTSIVFPFTAGRAIKRKSEHLLEHLGDLTYNILGEFTQEPDEDMCIPGQTHTDKDLRFIDDGLEKKYAPIMLRLAACWDEIWQATELLPAAKAEKNWWVWGLRREDNARFPVQSYGFIFKCATKILTTQLNLMSNLDNGSVRLAVCKRHKGLLQDVQNDIAACFSSLAGLIHKSAHCNEYYVCERFRAMSDSLVELYHGANANTRGFYDTDLETFAIFTKSAINLARQAALIFRELSPVIGLGMHNYIAASFAQTMDNYTYDGEPVKSREGSLAQMEKMPVRAPTVADMFKHAEDHRLAQVMLERVESFHADDNPFETENASGQWQLQSNWSVHAVPPRDVVIDISNADGGQPGDHHSTATTPQSTVAGAATPASMSQGSSFTPHGYRTMPSNANMELMSRLMERPDEEDGQVEDDALTELPQSHPGRHSEDVRLESAAMRRMSAEYEGSMDQWDDVTMRRALLGKLLTRRGTDTVAAYKATKIMAEPEGFPAEMTWDESLERRKKRQAAEQQAARRASQEWRMSVDVGSQRLQAPWDHHYVLRNLGLSTRETTPYGTPSNQSSLGNRSIGEKRMDSMPRRSSLGRRGSLGRQMSFKKEDSLERQRTLAREGAELAEAGLSMARDRKASLAKGQLSNLLNPSASFKKRQGHAGLAKDGRGIKKQRSKRRLKSKPDGSAVAEGNGSGAEGREENGIEDEGPPAESGDSDASVPPGPKFQKSRSFSEYTRMWRGPEDEPTEPSPKAPSPRRLQVRLGNGHGSHAHGGHGGFQSGSPLSPIADNEPELEPAPAFDCDVMAAALELQRTLQGGAAPPKRSNSWKKLQEVVMDPIMVPADSLGIRESDAKFKPPASLDRDDVPDNFFGAPSLSLESMTGRSLSRGKDPSLSSTQRRKSVGVARPGLWQSSVLFASTAPAAAVNPHCKTVIPPSAFAAVAPLPSEHHVTGESRAQRQASMNRKWNQSLDRRGGSGMRAVHTVDSTGSGSRQGSAAGSLSRGDPRYSALRELAKTQGGHLSEWKSEDDDSNLRAWLRSPYAQQMKKSASANDRANRSSVDLRKIRTGPYEAPKEAAKEAPRSAVKAPSAADWNPYTSNNTSVSSKASPRVERKQDEAQEGYPRINKEVWNLDEERPDAAFSKQQTYRDSFDIEEGPNLDFYTFDEVHAAKPWETGSSRKMRRVEEGMERAKQSVIDAARSFWEARVMGRA